MKSKPNKPAAKSTPPPRKNARRHDSDTVIEKGTVLSTRVSHPMKDRTVKAASVLGCKTTSDVLNIALIRLLNQLPELVTAYGKTGVVPMNLMAMTAFRALEPSPEEIAHAWTWVPEKVERLGMKRLQIEKQINELLERLAEVERHLKIKRLEPAEKELQSMQVEVDLI